MSTGLDHVDVSRWSRLGVRSHAWSDRAAAKWGWAAPFAVPIVLIVAAVGLWMVLSASYGDGGDESPAVVGTVDAVRPSAASDDADAAVARPSTPVAPVSTDHTQAAIAEPPPAARLRILGQSWKRAGLGSDAQATFTLRNDNAFAVKDIEIDCAFARRDGTHLTNRKRTIPVTLDPKARKRFARLHVGFVNVHASRINCSVMAASRV
jgi:hypothetical protein